MLTYLKNSTLVLIWLLEVFPLIYCYRSASVAGLCFLLFYIWIVLLFGDRTYLFKLVSIWDLYLISSISLYFIGTISFLMAGITLTAIFISFSEKIYMGLFNIIFLVHTLYLTDEAGIMTEEGVKELRIEYGIENILPEGKGLEIEREQWTVRKRVDSKVVIDKYGNAVLKSLLIDGKEIEF